MAAPVPVGPVANPIVPPTYNTSGITVLSGITPVSAIAQGPWFVEEQGLDISYKRVPVGSLSGFDLDLSSATVTEYHRATFLLCKVDAYYTSWKDWSTYQTSSWQQPQKFEFITASADELGRTYGALTASTLGPAGTIVTKQPFSNRVHWNDLSGHAVVAKRSASTTYYAVQRMQGRPDLSSVVNQTGFTANKFWWIGSENEGTLLDDWDTFCYDDALSYYIAGGYGTSQENLWNIFALIDQIGYRVANSALYSIPATVKNKSVIRDGGFLEYRTSRHDYSS